MKNYLFVLWITVLFFAKNTTLYGKNNPTDSLNIRKNLRVFTATSIGLYSTAMVGMNQLWYKNYPRSSFHFFNDNAQWRQVDKIGHSYTAFYLSELNYKVLQKIGMPEKKTVLWGGTLGFLWMLPIEILDGFSAGYGASSGDLMANFAGSLLFTSQKLMNNQILIRPKFKFRRSGFASQRPEVLGNNLLEEVLKDYNAQVYQLSFDIKKITKWKRYPHFINIAFGYGAGNILYGQAIENQNIGLIPYRRYQIGLDWNFSQIRTQSRFLNSILYVLNTISLPAPTLEFRRSKPVKFVF